MKLSQKILVICKRTKWQRDLLRYSTEENARKIYLQQRASYERIMSSHSRQIKNLERLENCLQGAKFIHHEELLSIDLNNFNWVISFGGDNHFVHVSHFVGDKPIIGLNSDPETSTGALLYYDVTSFSQQIQDHINKTSYSEFGSFLNIENWTKISGKIELSRKKQKIEVDPCTSEISARSAFHDHISRFLIRKDQQEWEEIKCSGLLLASGAGSSGWYCNGHPKGKGAVFAKDAPFFRSLARENNYFQRSKLKYLNPQINDGERLQIISQMDGEITVDSNRERVFPFPPGAVASFFLCDKRLKVVKSIDVGSS